MDEFAIKKIAVVDSHSHLFLKWDKKLNKNVENKGGGTPACNIHKSINSYHLIIFPFCENYHWYAFMFIRLVQKKYILIQFDSLCQKPRIEESEELVKWFKSSTDVVEHSLPVTATYPTAYSNQNDGYSCGSFVCIHVFNASVLSAICLTKILWTINFNNLMANSLTPNHTINDNRNETHNFCLLIKQVSNDNNSRDTNLKEQSPILHNNQKKY